jgi:hypothetical protein
VADVKTAYRFTSLSRSGRICQRRATVGFDALATITKKSPQSLMRMLGPKGNPQARNFFEIVAYRQKKEGLHLKAIARRGV